jgi:hypothetical protein
VSKAPQKRRKSATSPGKGTSSSRSAKRPFSLRRLARAGLITLAILAVPVAWMVVSEREARALADLDVIGSGEPVAVQVHDTGCPLCRRLRANAEEALANIDTPPEWRVVDITSSKGARLAGEQGVGHVSIVLFDARGQRSGVVEGVAGVEELEATFSDLRR